MVAPAVGWIARWSGAAATADGAKSLPAAIGRRLLEIIVYDKCCRIGGTLSLDDLAETSEIGDWKMPDFRMACAYAASQGWLIVQDDAVTLTMAGLAAA
jgi:hypothetical protein